MICILGIDEKQRTGKNTGKRIFYGMPHDNIMASVCLFYLRMLQVSFAM